MSTIGYYPIFCTTPELPVELNNTLATQITDIDGLPQNPLCLFLSPDQQTHHQGITPITSPLQSYFVDWDILDLYTFCSQQIRHNSIDFSTFIVVDQRTFVDGSVVVVSSESETINEDVVCERSFCPWDCRDVVVMVRCGISGLGRLLPLIEEDGLVGIKELAGEEVGGEGVVDV